jgi:hypothetical protein
MGSGRWGGTPGRSGMQVWRLWPRLGVGLLLCLAALGCRAAEPGADVAEAQAGTTVDQGAGSTSTTASGQRGGAGSTDAPDPSSGTGRYTAPGGSSGAGPGAAKGQHPGGAPGAPGGDPDPGPGNAPGAPGPPDPKEEEPGAVGAPLKIPALVQSEGQPLDKIRAELESSIRSVCGGTPCVDTVVRQTEPDRHPSCFVRYVPAPDFDLGIIEVARGGTIVLVAGEDSNASPCVPDADPDPGSDDAQPPSSS